MKGLKIKVLLFMKMMDRKELQFDVIHLKTKDFCWWISVVRNECKKLIFSGSVASVHFRKASKTCQ
jgi:hypothetical protein